MISAASAGDCRRRHRARGNGVHLARQQVYMVLDHVDPPAIVGSPAIQSAQIIQAVSLAAADGGGHLAHRALRWSAGTSGTCTCSATPWFKFPYT